MSTLAAEVSKNLRPNLADRVVNYFSPVRGAKRMRARATQAIAGSLFSSGLGGYRGARTDLRTTGGWFTGSGNADAASLGDLPTLRDRSRDLLRNSPLSVGAIGTVVQSVVGTGLALQAKLDTRCLGWTPE
jgi:capsid protein